MTVSIIKQHYSQVSDEKQLKMFPVEFLNQNCKVSYEYKNDFLTMRYSFAHSKEMEKIDDFIQKVNATEGSCAMSRTSKVSKFCSLLL